jgi:hypothetical protein
MKSLLQCWPGIKVRGGYEPRYAPWYLLGALTAGNSLGKICLIPTYLRWACLLPYTGNGHTWVGLYFIKFVRCTNGAGISHHKAM